MKREEIELKYAQRGISINGVNLPQKQNAQWGHLTGRVSSIIVYESMYQSILKKLQTLCRTENGSLDVDRYQQEKRKAFAELQKRFNNGEIKMSDKNIKLLQYLENLYFSFMEEDVEVERLRVEDGKVIIPKEQVFHNCNPKTLEDLESYADLGIVASEWFGYPESNHEGRFCCFLLDDTVRDPNKCRVVDLDGTIVSDPFASGVRIYIDTNNPLWKKLESLDFFQYESLKKNSPEKIPERYPKEIIDLYEQIIEPISLGAEGIIDLAKKSIGNYSVWRAIPGGIPPQLIVGIQIGSQEKELIEASGEIQKMFPNAVIFDETHRVLTHENGDRLGL